MKVMVILDKKGRVVEMFRPPFPVDTIYMKMGDKVCEGELFVGKVIRGVYEEQVSGGAGAVIEKKRRRRVERSKDSVVHTVR